MNHLDQTPDPFIDCDAWCRTEKIKWSESTATPYTFVWTINDFRATYDKPETSIESTTFDVPVPNSGNITVRWKLLLKIDGNSLNVELEYCGDFEENFNELLEGISEMKAKYKFSILDSNRARQHIVHSSEAEEFDYSGSVGGIKKLIEKANLNGELLPNDCLHIVCDITMFAGCRSLKGQKYDGNLKDSNTKRRLRETQLSNDLLDAFSKNESRNSDVIINCNGKVFNCHKFILGARSPVFNAMFQADMKEGNAREVNIDNLDPKVLGDMLQFIYTGKIPNTDEFMKDLLEAANYYQLEQLKIACEESLCLILQSNNCIGFLIFADTFSANLLRKKSLVMVAKNLSVLMKTSEWKDDLLNYPLLKEEIIENALALKV